MPVRAKTYAGIIIVSGSLTLIAALTNWRCADPMRFAVYLVLALVAGTLKVRLPGMMGTYSLNFLLVLISIGELTLAETAVIACLSMIVQCSWRTTVRPGVVQVLFNVAATAISVSASLGAAERTRQLVDKAFISPLLTAAVIYFVTNTLLVSGALALVEAESFRKIWAEWFYWSFSYYVAGVATALIAIVTSHYFGWQFSLLVIPVMYLEYLCLSLNVRGRRANAS